MSEKGITRRDVLRFAALGAVGTVISNDGNAQTTNDKEAMNRAGKMKSRP